MNFLMKTLLTNNSNTQAMDVELEDLESGSRAASLSSHQPTTGTKISSVVVANHPLDPLLSSPSSAPLSPIVPNQSAPSFLSFPAQQTVISATINSGPNQSASGPSSDTASFHFSPQTAISTTTLHASRKRAHQIEDSEHNDRVRIIERPTIESTKHLANLKAAKQQARTSVSRTIREEYDRKAKQLTQEANHFVEEINKRAEEATRHTAEEATRFVEEANRRAEEAHRRAEEVIRVTKEAKESFVAELEKRRLEEENRVKEMAEQASKAISAAQARAQVAEQQMLEASKIAEEKIQKAAREASKLQEAFMEAMKRFNLTPSKKFGEGKRQEEMDSMDSGSENEVLHSLSQIPDDDELMSLATLPPESSYTSDQEIRVSGEGRSELNDRKKSHRGSLSKTPSPEIAKMVERVVDAAININNKGKQKQDPRVPPPRKFPPPRGGQHPINIHVSNPAPNTSQDSDMVAAVPTNHDATSESRARSSKACKTNPFSLSKGVSGLESEATEANQEPNRRRRQNKKQEFFGHVSLRGSDEARTKALREVRGLMNELLHINNDEQIKSVESATVEEVCGYQEGTHKGPTLDPMRAFLKLKDRTERVAVKAWNTDLAELFVDYFEDEKEMNLSREERIYIGDLFLDRLGRLARKWQEFEKLTEEEREIKKVKYHKHQRMNSRRVELYDTRWNITHGNVKNRDGTENLGWKATLKMIEMLEAAGMSSDESENDEETGAFTYIVKKRAWRSREVLDRLKLIDQDRNTTSAYGGARAGNPPRVRKRVPYAKESIRAAVPNCPKNFYGREFIANISSYRVLNELNEHPAVDLGYLQEE